jgi:hypothetical protein
VDVDIEAQHPDTFLMYQKAEDTVSVLARLKEARLTDKKPTPTRNNSLRGSEPMKYNVSGLFLSEGSLRPKLTPRCAAIHPRK